MQYEIFDRNVLVNIIEADEAFCAEFCRENGLDYRARDVQARAPQEVPVLSVEEKTDTAADRILGLEARMDAQQSTMDDIVLLLAELIGGGA